MGRVQLTFKEAVDRAGISPAKMRTLIERLSIKEASWTQIRGEPKPKYWYSDIMRIKKYYKEVYYTKTKAFSSFTINGGK